MWFCPPLVSASSFCYFKKCLLSASTCFLFQVSVAERASFFQLQTKVSEPPSRNVHLGHAGVGVTLFSSNRSGFGSLEQRVIKFSPSLLVASPCGGWLDWLRGRRPCVHHELFAVHHKRVAPFPVKWPPLSTQLLKSETSKNHVHPSYTPSLTSMAVTKVCHFYVLNLESVWISPAPLLPLSPPPSTAAMASNQSFCLCFLLPSILRNNKHREPRCLTWELEH